MRWLSALAAALTAAPLLAAQPLKLEQSDRTTLLLEAPAQRIITLAPSLAELTYSAGAGDRLIATVEYSDFPQQARSLPRIGDAFRFDLEQIVALKPDLVMAWSSGNPLAAQARLESLGLTVWKIEVASLDDIPATLRAIATATGLEEPLIASALDARIEQLKSRYVSREPLRYFYQVSQKPLYTLNGNHIVSQALSLCRGVNVFAELPVIAPQVSLESVLAENPEVIFAPAFDGQTDNLDHWQSWPRLAAVNNGALHTLEADRINRATPRMLDSIENACTLLDRYRPQP